VTIGAEYGSFPYRSVTVGGEYGLHSLQLGDNYTFGAIWPTPQAYTRIRIDDNGNDNDKTVF